MWIIQLQTSTILLVFLFASTSFLTKLLLEPINMFQQGLNSLPHLPSASGGDEETQEAETDKAGQMVIRKTHEWDRVFTY